MLWVRFSAKRLVEVKRDMAIMFFKGLYFSLSQFIFQEENSLIYILEASDECGDDKLRRAF